jgi:tetratricopeptide (TPR) repeat protein
MKNLAYIFFLLCLPVVLHAQKNSVVDQEKLLEFYQSQRYMEAAQYLQTIYGTETQVPKELSQLGYANLMAGNLAAAEKSYQQLYLLQPGSIPVLFNLASISRRRGDEAKAKAYYLKIIKIDSLNFNVYRQLAAMIEMPAAPDKIYYLKKANSLQPAHADVAFDLATGLNLIKRNDSAYVVLQTALSADTLNMSLLKAKMPVCISLEKIDETLKTGNLLMMAGDSSGYVLNNMGKAYYNKKNYSKALEMFTIIEKMQQQNESTLYYTSICYRELNDFTRAADYMKMAIKEGISPYTSKYYKVLGEIYEKNAMVKNARQSYFKSLEFENDGGVYYNLALLNDFKLNNKRAALQYYNQYLASKPNPDKLKEVITYVNGRIDELKNTPVAAVK